MIRVISPVSSATAAKASARDLFTQQLGLGL
jgi:hypothetical protein